MSDDLAGHRKRTGATLIRARIAEKLRTIAGHIARDNVKAGSPTAAFVVLVVPDAPPVVTWAGEVSWDDLQLAHYAMADADHARYRTWDGQERSIGDCVVEGWEGRQAHKARNARKAIETANEYPWQCEHCDRRFKTERGANQHQRRCVWTTASRRRAERQNPAAFSLTIVPAPGDDPLPEP